MFWERKDDVEYERGDSIKVKNGVKFPKINVDISNWHGRVVEVYKKSVEVELDSIALKNFNVLLLNHYKEVNEYPHLIMIPIKNVEKTESRDEYKDVELAQDEIIDRIDAENKSELEFQKLSRKWTRYFIRSEIYWSMEKRLRFETDSVIELFTNQMYDYEGKTPSKWNTRSAKEVFLNWAPNKITADKNFFEAFGEILLKYFEFLENRKYLKAKPLHELLTKVKKEIVVKSQNSSNWGIAKSFLMGAKTQGIDLNNKRELDKYLKNQQLKHLDRLDNKNQ